MDDIGVGIIIKEFPKGDGLQRSLDAECELKTKEQNLPIANEEKEAYTSLITANLSTIGWIISPVAE